jgi:hypothetical protein
MLYLWIYDSFDDRIELEFAEYTEDLLLWITLPVKKVRCAGAVTAAELRSAALVQCTSNPAFQTIRSDSIDCIYKRKNG